MSKKCKYCDGEGKWELFTISTHDIYEKCEYCNGTGLKDKKLASKVKEKNSFKPQLSPYEILDGEGIQVC